jgi:glycosyltransferase involved in cell wall biosynthesis
VLHLSPGRLFGGLETLLVILARHRGLCPALCPEFAVCFEGRVGRELSEAGIPVHRLGAARLSRPWTVWAARRRLRQLLRRTTFDVAVCHECWPHALFAPVLRRCGVPLVFWGHDVHRRTHWLEWWAARTSPDLVIGNSRWACSGLSRLFPGVPASLLSLPVPEPAGEDWPAARHDIRAALGTSAEATVIVVAARLERLKGHAVLLRALGSLTGLGPWECWIVGGAQRPHEVAYLGELRRLAETVGVADRVRFLGHRADVRRLLAAADIYCQPNTGPESFGIAFVEALYAGLPVVTTAIGGALEIVDDSCGILVAPGEPSQVTDSLARLITDSERRASLGRGGPVRARALCAPATHMEQLAAALARVARRSGDIPRARRAAS